MKALMPSRGSSLLIRVMIALLWLSGTNAWAQSSDFEKDLQDFEEFREKRDNAIDEVETSLRKLEEEKASLEELVTEQKISIEEGRKKLGQVLGKYGHIVGNLEAANAAQKEIIDEYRLYQYQQRAKVFMPLLAAILAYSLTSGEEGNKPVINAFAGYGAAHMLEDTGYGLGNPLGRLTFNVFSW